MAGFLVLVLWRRLRDRDGTFGEVWFVRALGRLADRAARTSALVYGFTAIAALLLVGVSLRRYLAFDNNGDLAIFDQALWNTTRGAFLRSSFLPGVPREAIIFSDHFDPLQLLLVPLFALFPSPLLLLAVQAIMLALGAVPLYWLARDRFPGQALAAVFPILYLLYLPLRGANRYDYHPSALAPPLLLFALYFMERARWGRMILFLVMAGLLKENIPIAGAAIGVYLLLVKRRRCLGLVLAACFGLWFYAGFAWIIPAFTPGGVYAHFLSYPAFGGTPSRTFLAPLLQPLGFLETLAASPERKLLYVLYVFGPVAFLPFLSPSRLLLGLPFLAQILLSNVPLQTSLRTHHAAELIPFVFFGALGGASTLIQWGPRTLIRAVLGDGAGLPRAVAALLLLGSALFHDFPEMFYVRSYARTSHHERLDTVLRAIPADAPLSTSGEIAPHVAHRRKLYRFPALGLPGAAEAEVVILDRTLANLASLADAIAALPAKGYEKVVDRDGILVFRKRP